ncbi:protein of unknown function [Candidatus Methylocalor cossyra]|uniref:DUF3015 domain-containing protein n=2 Tax=Candidatus Methylocalor cossyra TaxID=3108543 RepID=A0ABP1C9R5_9GAMM
MLPWLALLWACAVTTDSTRSSTETFENTTEASSDFTSSTSPRDKERTSKYSQVSQFVAGNFERVRQDVALGGGEHLAALASLLEVPEADRPAFYRFAKTRFSTWFPSERATPEEVVARLGNDLKRHTALNTALP